MDVSTEDNGFKWFGEGFDGFPKRLPDDCVEYVIWVIDAKLQSHAATRSRLNQILKGSEHLKKQYLKDYIWQRDNFDLKLFPQPSNTPGISSKDERVNDNSSHNAKGPPRLRGRTNFGDSVADEWLIVFLLFELSKRFPDAWIRVYDTDGEFLLIEAANALPKWLNPDIAEHRVWISNGHLRIIPLDATSKTRNLTFDEALSFIRSNPDKLIISPFIEDEAFYRIRDYPSAIASSFHNALVRIPRRLSYILHRNPAYISPAVEAFYLRDPVSLKPLSTKDLSTLFFPPEDFVEVSCKFTRVGYAQLRSQVFDPPPAWTAVIPHMQDPKAAMGMKMTCGFEMLVSDPQNQDTRTVREIKLLLDDLVSEEDALPTNSEISSWPQTQDEEKWLDIDYKDFEAELAGKGRKKSGEKGTGFGDPNAQDHLRKMVSRFEDFLNDEDAGAEGVDDDDDDDDESGSTNEEDSASSTGSGEDKNGSYDEAEFEKAMKEMMGMSPDFIEKDGLLEEARKLAIQDEKLGQAMDEDEEMKKVMEMMEKELKGHGALDLSDGRMSRKPRVDTKGKKSTLDQPVFGPVRPPEMLARNAKTGEQESADEDIGPGEEELSSDDEEFNDVDLGLAKNMLEAFKGQAGMSGPAGNLMRAMGVNLPRDEGDDK